MKHPYTADTKITMHVSTRVVGSENSDTQTVNEWTGLTDSRLKVMSEAEVEKELDEAFSDFMANTCDSGWYVAD